MQKENYAYVNAFFFGSHVFNQIPVLLIFPWFFPFSAYFSFTCLFSVRVFIFRSVPIFC